MNGADIISLKGVSRHFQSGTETVTVLRDMTLSIGAGEMVAIVGASGSGKSTLMNLIGCLDKPSAGEITINGVATHQADENQLAELRSRHLGFIFQRYHLMPWLSALENVAIPSVYTDMAADMRASRASYLLHSLGLGERLHYQPAQLSGGQQQRVSVARALMNGAEIILADEPTGALDRTSGRALMNILHALHQAGHTVVIVTHDKDVAQQAQRIVEISDGRILKDELNPLFRSDNREVVVPPVATLNRPSLWQRLRDAFTMAWRALVGHRMRAFLSMLGIIIGISSVVSSMAIGEGARQSILQEMNNLGSNTLDVRPGLDWGLLDPAYANALSVEDVQLLKRQPWIDSVSPVFTKSVSVTYGAKVAGMAITGVNEHYFQVQGTRFDFGNRFTFQDVTEREPVVVIDNLLRDTLFEPGAQVTGKVILLDGVPFRISGVTAKKGMKMIGGTPSGWMPWTTLLARMSGEMPIEYLTLRLHDGVTPQTAQQQVEKILFYAHGKRDFFTQTNDQFARAMQKTSDSMSLLISAIAAISLLVGGVGVMNIMLVSVTERVHEIGIRLSVGARPVDIMTQFLIEAVVICMLGGLLGMAGSWLAGKLFSLFTNEFSMVFTATPVLIAVFFSALIGLGFGFFPARNAARLNPTEALARE